MDHYESEATVVIDGEDIDVYVQFVVDELRKVWYGTLNSDVPGFGFKLVAGNRSVLRLPSGKEAAISPEGTSSDAEVRFRGSGAPPL